VVGYAFDGFPITGPKLPSGKYLMSNDLDVCHGLTSTITLDGKSVSIYHYVMTQDFPYSVSCFRGTSTFKPSGGNSQHSMGSSNMNMPPTPPQEAISACANKKVGDACSVGPNTSTCDMIGNTLACKKPN
jgi:hypothetical protein